MRPRLVIEALCLVFLAYFLSGCGARYAHAALDEVESKLDENPREALCNLEEMDTLSFHLKSLRMRYNLLYLIALDKNHIDDADHVSLARKTALWYSRFGNRYDKLRAIYYYGDQLLGAGKIEDSAVQLMRAENEAVHQKKWFFAGMSARSLFYLYSQSVNHPEEVSCMERAVRYFHLAGKEVHEDDARIKLATAYYDDNQLEKADSLFDMAIEVASSKHDTVRWRNALVKSVAPMLLEGHYRPEEVISRLSKAEELHFRPDSRIYADYALAFALIGNKVTSEDYLSLAYSCLLDRSDSAFVNYTNYQIKMAEGDYLSALPLLRQSHAYVNDFATKTLEQSIIKAQNNYLKAVNDNLLREIGLRRIIAILITLLAAVIAIVFLYIHRRRAERRRLLEAERQLQLDRYRWACEELGSLGLRSLDTLSEVYISQESKSGEAMLDAYSRVIERFRKDESFRGKFLENVDTTHGNVISLIKKQIPGLSADQLLFFACLIQGFSYTTITVLMGKRQKQNMYVRRQNLIRTINEVDPPDKALFLSFLPNRPTRPRQSPL